MSKPDEMYLQQLLTALNINEATINSNFYSRSIDQLVTETQKIQENINFLNQLIISSHKFIPLNEDYEALSVSASLEAADAFTTKPHETSVFELYNIHDKINK